MQNGQCKVVSGLFSVLAGGVWRLGCFELLALAVTMDLPRMLICGTTSLATGRLGKNICWQEYSRDGEARTMGYWSFCTLH